MLGRLWNRAFRHREQSVERNLFLTWACRGNVFISPDLIVYTTPSIIIFRVHHSTKSLPSAPYYSPQSHTQQCWPGLSQYVSFDSCMRGSTCLITQQWSLQIMPTVEPSAFLPHKVWPLVAQGSHGFFGGGSCLAETSAVAESARKMVRRNCIVLDWLVRRSIDLWVAFFEDRFSAVSRSRIYEEEISQEQRSFVYEGSETVEQRSEVTCGILSYRLIIDVSNCWWVHELRSDK